jgi:hypothetical protein
MSELFAQKSRAWVQKLEAFNFGYRRARDDFVKTLGSSVEAHHAEEIYKNTYYELMESQIYSTNYSLSTRSYLWGVNLRFGKAKE